MEISLIRHGKSQFTNKDKITSEGFKRWVQQYDSHGIMKDSIIPPSTAKYIENAKVVISSDLRRSIDSVKSLNPKVQVKQASLYREVELPTFSKKSFGLKLSPNIWAVVARIMWFCGYSNECESRRKAKARAQVAAQQLINYADEYENVALVGHGFFNRFIAKELKNKGWNGKSSGAKHWSCVTYTFNNETCKGDRGRGTG